MSERQPIKQIDSETSYYLRKHVEDPEVDIGRILDEHERMRQALEDIRRAVARTRGQLALGDDVDTERTLYRVHCISLGEDPGQQTCENCGRRVTHPDEHWDSLDGPNLAGWGCSR